jgi:hypothetical protein
MGKILPPPHIFKCYNTILLHILKYDDEHNNVFSANIIIPVLLAEENAHTAHDRR